MSAPGVLLRVLFVACWAALLVQHAMRHGAWAARGERETSARLLARHYERDYRYRLVGPAGPVGSYRVMLTREFDAARLSGELRIDDLARLPGGPLLARQLGFFGLGSDTARAALRIDQRLDADLRPLDIAASGRAFGMDVAVRLALQGPLATGEILLARERTQVRMETADLREPLPLLLALPPGIAPGDRWTRTAVEPDWVTMVGEKRLALSRSERLCEAGAWEDVDGASGRESLLRIEERDGVRPVATLWCDAAGVVHRVATPGGVGAELESVHDVAGGRIWPAGSAR